MTVPAPTTPTAWDQDTHVDFDAVDRLNSMVSGNDNLITEPGLVAALWKGNATPQQAQAIDQFVGGLHAEAKVRTAAASGTQIPLSDTEQAYLNGMGIDYSQVIKQPIAPLDQLRAQMAAKGLQPVVDKNGHVEVDANGNPKTEALEQPEQHSSGGGFWSSVGHIVSSVGHGIVRGTKDALSGLNKAWNYTSSEVSQGVHHFYSDTPSMITAGQQGAVTSAMSGGQAVHVDNTTAADRQAKQNEDELMRQLGYDPTSFMSRAAFRARGFTFNDTSSAANSWDSQSETDKLGMDGQQAVVQAEAFVDDPKQYMSNILSDTSLSDDERAARVALVNSPQFATLVKQVTGSRQNIGTDFADAIGLDPVTHSTAFKITSAAADTAASFFADPLAIGLGTVAAVQRDATAIKNFADAGRITDILTRPAAPLGATRRVQNYVRDMVSLGQQAHDAAGDTVKLAQIQAKAQANPLGGLLADFIGESQILGRKGEDAALEAFSNGERADTAPYVVGHGEPIDTYEKAVEYLASRDGLFRLMGGRAPVEFSTMPGALSSYGYSKLKGTVASWNTAWTAGRTQKAAADLLVRASKDDALRGALLDDGTIARILPQSDDAVDFLSGQVVAAREAVDSAKATLAGATGADRAAALTQVGAARQGLASAKRALAGRTAELADESPLAVTPKGLGQLRANKLRYGLASAPSTKLGKVTSIYTLGMAERAKVIAARMVNQLPRDTRVNVFSSADAQTVRQIARTYLTSGDADLLAARWTNGTADTRRAIVDGLYDQVYHAAGLSRTQAGRDLIDARHADAREAYSTNGFEYVDPNGQVGAQWPGQVQTVFTLPNFGKVQKAAGRIGLYEATMGRFFNTESVEQLMALWRTSLLAAPVTANRAIIEPWLNAIMQRDGLAGVALAAKKVLRDSGKLDAKGIARSRVAQSIANTIGFRDVGRLYGRLLKRGLTQDELEALQSMPEDLLVSRLLHQARSHWAQEVDPSGAGDASRIAAAGLEPKKVTYNTDRPFDPKLRQRAGFEVTDEVDGMAGANAYAFTLGSRVNTAPVVAKAILDRIEHPDEFDVEHVVKALESPDAKPLMDQTLYGKVFTDLTTGKQQKAITADQIALGKRQWADQITADLHQLTTGRNGAFQSKIADFIREHGHGPDADWIQDNVKDLNRPHQMIRPTWTAAPPIPEKDGSLRSLKNAWVAAAQETTGKAYSWLVERNIQRNATGPLFAGAYAKAKVGLKDYKAALVSGGFSEPAAERMTAEIAAQQAWDRIALMVDDPALKMQMDVTGRSFFAFSRATTAMLRRWGRTFWQNPDMARRAQLVAEGANHAGLVYQDPTTNQWMFALPATGVAQEVLFHSMSHIPGLSGLALFPYADFEGRVSSIIPGSSDPFQYQTTPLVSIAGRKVANLFPNSRMIFDEMDSLLNGQQGQGKSAFDTLMPRLIGQYVDSDGPLAGGIDGNEARNSILTSAMVGSLYNLYAAGHVPPDGASDVEEQQFLDRLKTGTRSTLFARFLLGTISPATLTTPDGAAGAAGQPDFAFAEQGVKNLDDEFKQIVNEAGNYQDALAIWTALHPDKLIYTAPESTSLAKGASLPATKAAYDWMAQHADFIKKYGTLAAYFLPPATGDEQYSEQAYRAQIEEGFREKKTPKEFLDGVRISNASTDYYAAKDDYTAKVAAAKAAGNSSAVTTLNSQWAAWSKEFKGEHPTFAHYLSGVSANSAAGQTLLANLQTMVDNHAVPGSDRLKQAVANMLEAVKGYQTYVNAHQGTTSYAVQLRSQAKDQLQQFMDATLQAEPDVKGLYNGVFRPALDNVLDYAD